MSREREIDDRIADWVDGRLVGKDHERFEAELRVNPQLRRDLEQYERTVATVRAALRAEAEPVQLADRVLAAIAAGETPAGQTATGLRWRPLLWSLATAAALLTLAVLVDAWFGPPPTKATQTAANDRPEPTRETRAPTEPGSEPTSQGLGEERDLDALLGTTREGDDVVERSEAEAGTVGTGTGELAVDGAAGVPAPRAPAADGVRDRRGRAEDPAADPAARDRRFAAPNDTAGADPAGAAAKGPRGGGPAGRGSEAVGPAGSGPGAGTLKGPPAPTERGVALPFTPAEQHAEDERERAAETGAELRLVEQTALAEEVVEDAAGTQAGAPLPLVVLQGRAPGAKEVWSLRQRPTGAASERAKAAVDTEALARRIDEFLIAQVAELGAPSGPRAERERDEVRAKVAPPAAAAPDAWVELAGVRLQRLGAPPAAATGRARVDTDGVTWHEQDWLVEGRRENIAVVLQRVAAFADDFRLTLRSSETRRVREAEAPAADTAAGRDPAAVTPTRVVLRLRLQAR